MGAGSALLVWSGLALTVSALVGRAPWQGRLVPRDRHPVAEASGVTRLGDHVLLVDDERPGVYFRAPAPHGRSARIALPELEERRLAAGGGAADLESIAVLADGRVVVLSERQRALVSEEGIVAEYDDPLSEVGTRGLEGLAVRALPDGGSEVAVVWEGGFIRSGDLPYPLRPFMADTAVNPAVVVHTVPAGAINLDVRERTGARVVMLRVPLIASRPSRDSSFRVPDLVWHRLEDGRRAFIALLNSHHVPLLQRFDAETGEPVGPPLDLSRVASIPDSIRRLELNWEGLDWFVPGESVILVDDVSASRDTTESPYLVVLPLPDAWRSH
jgi:hypothetical protein